MKRLALAPAPLLSTLVFGLAIGVSACRDDGGVAATQGDESGTSGGGGTDTEQSADESSASGTESSGEASTGEPEQTGIRVLRDGRGVPHIVADTDAGAFYGLGWASAEDRLVQMHVSALSVQGRLAEHFGSDYFEDDQRMRTMGHWRHAQRMSESLDAEHRALLEAYAQGINDYAEAHPEGSPTRVAELGIEVQAWSPAHSLAVWYRVSDLFTNDPLAKALALEDFEALVVEVGLDQAIDETLGTPGPGQPEAAVVQAADVPTEVHDAIVAYAASMGYDEQSTQPHDYGHLTPKFSHAWVMSGDRTTTGEAALVSDPQVAVGSPNFLYEWAIVGETVHARGATAAGVPGLLIGFTPDVAWGMTAAGIDQRDLFRLQMTDETHYLVDGVEYELSVDTETIYVAGGNARQVEIRESLWGPVITPLLPAGVVGEYALKGLPFAVTDRDPFVSMVAMMRSENLDELRAALEDWTTPSANFVAAGSEGEIFFTVVGDIPLRSTLSPLGGKIAQDGSSTVYDWVDLIPNEYKPWVLNPSAGYILSANHRPVASWYPLPLGVGTGGAGDTIRSRRLRELLEALPAMVEPQAVLDDVQWDCVNAARRDLVAVTAHVQALQPGRLSPPTLSLLTALTDWLAAGGSMHTDQTGVFLADHIGTKFRIQQTGPVLSAEFGGGANGLDLFLDTLIAAIAADPSYVPSDEAIAYLDLVMTDAWNSTSMQVPDSSQWDEVYANGSASPSFPYLVGADLQQSPLGPVVQSPTLACADGNTIWSQKGETYSQYVSLADVDGSVTVLAPGNSDDPGSAAFDAQLDAWAEGTLQPAALSVAGIEALAVDEELVDWEG